MSPSVSSSIYLTPTVNDEIKKIITELNCNSLNSLDIKTKFLKLASDEVSYVISYIINTSFLSGKFPNSLKIACVTEINPVLIIIDPYLSFQFYLKSLKSVFIQD